jgi:hypothetical protein
MEKLEGVAPVGNAGRGDAPGSGRNEDPATIHFGKGFHPSPKTKVLPCSLFVFLILSF